MKNYSFNYYHYNKKLNKNLNINFTIIFLLIILFLGLAVFLNQSYNCYNFYFIEIDNFQTYSTALTLSQEIKSQLGATHIYYDDNYKVLSTVFFNKKDAKSIASSLINLYPNCKVYTLKTKKVLQLNAFTKQQSTCVKNITKILQETLNYISNSSCQISKQNFKFNNFQLELHEKTLIFNEEFKNFVKLFKKDFKQNTAKEYLREISSSISNLYKVENYTNLKEIINFELVNQCINFYNFLNCFN